MEKEFVTVHGEKYHVKNGRLNLSANFNYHNKKLESNRID